MWVYKREEYVMESHWNIKKLAIDSVSILVGNFVLAYAVQSLLLPNQILSGGVSGIAIAIYPIFHFNEELVINTLVIGLFFVGWLFLGKEFAIKTGVSSIIYPIFISMLSGIEPITRDPLLASLYGGLFVGAGIGLVFRANASTGGMDIPTLILEKYTNIEAAKWVLLIDGLTILLGLYAYDLESVLIGMISVITSSYAINLVVMFGAQEAKKVEIITNKVSEVKEFIEKKLDRGCSLVPVVGGYTNEHRTMIMVILDKSQYPLLNEGIHSIDPNAFMIVTDTRDVHGNGFTFHTGA